MVFFNKSHKLVVEPTHLKNTSQNGIISPIFGVKIKNIWNHHLEINSGKLT